MSGHDVPGGRSHLLLQNIAIALRAQGFQLSFQLPRISPGNLRVALLMTFDVGRKRVPDQRQFSIGALAVRPARQENFGVQRYLDLANRALSAFFGITDLTAELDFGGTGMARTGRLRQRPMPGQFLIEIVSCPAADLEIGNALFDLRLRPGTERDEKQRRCC